MWCDAQRFLDDTTKELRLPLGREGQDYEIVYRIEGTFTGTIQAQDQDGNALSTVELGATGTVSAADPTGEGTFHASPASDDTEVVIKFSSYTSGEAKVSAVAVPASP